MIPKSLSLKFCWFILKSALLSKLRSMLNFSQRIGKRTIHLQRSHLRFVPRGSMHPLVLIVDRDPANRIDGRPIARLFHTNPYLTSLFGSSESVDSLNPCCDRCRIDRFFRFERVAKASRDKLFTRPMVLEKIVQNREINSYPACATRG